MSTNDDEDLGVGNEHDEAGDDVDHDEPEEQHASIQTADRRHENVPAKTALCSSQLKLHCAGGSVVPSSDRVAMTRRCVDIAAWHGTGRSMGPNSREAAMTHDVNAGRDATVVLCRYRSVALALGSVGPSSHKVVMTTLQIEMREMMVLSRRSVNSVQ